MALDSSINVNVYLTGSTVGRRSFGVPLIMVAPASGYNFAITAVSTADKKFTIAGDQTAKFAVDSGFVVYGSTGNNKSYTVHTRTAVGGGTSTELVVHETIPNATVDGYIGNAFGGSLYREYGSEAELTADAVPLGGTTIAAEIAIAFSQNRRPKKIAVGLWYANFASIRAALTELYLWYQGFYLFTVLTSTDTDLVNGGTGSDTTSASSWAETKGGAVFFVGQTDTANSADTAYDSGTSTDPGAYAHKRELEHTAICYHPTETELLAWGIICNRAAYGPDDYATTWCYASVDGITAATYTTTQQSNLESRCVNYYTTFGGVGAFGKGVLSKSSTLFCDQRVCADWVGTRIKEDLIAALAAATNLGRKIPHNSTGYNQLGGIAKGRLLQGESIGHFNPDSSVVILPDEEDVSDDDKEAREFEFSCTTEPAGAIHDVTVNVYISSAAA